eukprot:TRINITY_DN3641_c1_g1_i1.p1 TRINITY_DN3641_c1_g1~~TRINITY_DN3641_c1_g1_i1.p1  ORF type:complete len:199 (-),score=27.69 TRINITY_DN3641_c1_g1_i1:185-721(-)
MVDRTLDELILEDGGRRGKKGKGGGSRKGGLVAAGKSGQKCPWDVGASEGADGQAFWLHDNRAGGGPPDDADAPWMKGKGKGAKGKNDSWGPVRNSSGKGGGGRYDPYDRSAGAEGKWRHDLFDGHGADRSFGLDDDKYSYSGLYGPRAARKSDNPKGKGKSKGKSKGKWRSDMDYWW